MHALRRVVAGLAVMATAVGGAALVSAGPAGAPTFAPTGSGTMTVTRHTVKSSSATSLVFTYTAKTPSSTTTALTNGKLEIVVPSGWSTPQKINLSAAGAVTTNCMNETGGTSTITVATSMTIKITTVKLDYGHSCTITYGVGGPGDADAPATAGTDHFTTSEISTSTGSTFAPLTPAFVNVGVGAPGTGTITVTPTATVTASTGNTFTFTYTAAAGGLTHGQLISQFPTASWPAASTTSSAQGYTTTTCTGTVTPFTGGANVETLVLLSGSSCTVVYGSKAGGGPGLTVPSSTGTKSFTVAETPVAGTESHDLSAPTVNLVSASGSGSMTVSPTSVAESSSNTFTFTFHPASGGLTHGKLSLQVPSGWTAPVTSAAAGKVASTCGTVGITGGTSRIIKVVTVTKTSACTITYGTGTNKAVAPSAGGTYTFTAKSASVSSGTLTALSSSPVVAVPGGSGVGSVSVTPPTGVPASATGVQLEFLFKAASGGLTHGKLSLLVPSPWPAPVTATSSGKVSLTTCGTATIGITGATSRTITVSTVTKGPGATCKIFYGATPHTISAPSTTGSYTFAAKEASTSGASLASLATSPTVAVLAPNGSGTLTVSPTSVTSSSTGNTLTFTYTAASGGIAGGSLTITVPAGWSTPQHRAGHPGLVSTTCTGDLTLPNPTTPPSTNFIGIYDLYLSGGDSCTITYGDGGGTSGVTAPATTKAYTFTAFQGSTGDTYAALASSPTVSVTSGSGGAPPGSSSSQTGTSHTNTATATDSGNSATATGGKGTVTVAQYSTDPESSPTFTSSGEYFDVQLSSGNTFSHLTVTVGHTDGGNLLYWWNPTTAHGKGSWEPVSPVTVKTGNLVATLSATSSPTLKELTGTVFGVGKSSSVKSPTPHASPSQGYWLAGSDGGIFSFGDAGYYGSVPGDGIHVSDIVAMSSAGGPGYWLAGKDGGVFTFGDAHYYGSLPGDGIHVSDIAGMVRSFDGKGYWLVGRDGGVFTFGDAHYDGSLPADGIHVSDIVGMASSPDGGGYWLVGADGGVFSFGDAGYYGSLPQKGIHASDIVGIAQSTNGGGYWLVGADGGVFSFGDARYYGSVPGDHVSVSDAIGLVGTQTGAGGYWIMTGRGQVFDFGSATSEGSEAGRSLSAPIAGTAAP